jgi:hypothetical protein
MREFFNKITGKKAKPPVLIYGKNLSAIYN